MEIAKNVRDFLVGMKESLSPEEDQLLTSLQTLHEHYLNIMNSFSVQMDSQALRMSPEARVEGHQLRLKIYQDWRAKLMERVFDNSKEIASVEDAEMHATDCDCCICELTRRLACYEGVTSSYIQASIGVGSPENEGGEIVFTMPDFLTT
jgi:hypothetical protein